MTRVAPADRTRAMEIARSNREFERQRTQAETARGRTPVAGRAGAGVVVSTPEKAALPRRSAIVSPRPTPAERAGQGTPPSMTGASGPTSQVAGKLLGRSFPKTKRRSGSLRKSRRRGRVWSVNIFLAAGTTSRRGHRKRSGRNLNRSGSQRSGRNLSHSLSRGVWKSRRDR